MSIRIAIGGINHETSTFTTVATTLQNYLDRHYVRGEEYISRFRGANTPTGGYIARVEAHGFDLIPTLLAQAHPSGPTPRKLFDEFLGEILRGIAEANPIDGVLLELHGSMVVGDLDGEDGIGDVEGHILAAVRELVGPDVPILAELDIHSNVSQRMVEQADVLIGRETYPEIDQAERGRECADVLKRILKDGLRPTMALHQIPMIWGLNQVTAHSPMREAIAELHRIEAQPGVICGSIATGFGLADVPDMGASVYIATDDDQALAQRYADQLGEWIYERRADWDYPMPTTREALARAEVEGRYPVIFADSRDNTGGGSPGDSTGVLQTFLEQDLQDACILYIVDPEAVNRCQQAGVGATLTLDVGAKSTPLQGTPVRMKAEVLALSDGQFKYDGPMNAGLTASMGPSAHIQERGVHVLVVTKREQPFCTAFARTMDLDPRKMRYIGIKSSAHFRAAFESWAGAIYVVDEPSVHAMNHLTFRRLGRSVYPLDED